MWPYNGHTWVMDGYEKYDVYKGCGEVAIRSSKQPTLSSYGVLFYHFNMGWGGTYDGWYGTALSYHINDSITYDEGLKRLDINKK